MDIIEVHGTHLKKNELLQLNIWCQKRSPIPGYKKTCSSIYYRAYWNLIANYTRESGVRQLDRLIHTSALKIARALVETKICPLISQETIEHLIGPREFIQESTDHKNQIGISNGLAWTSVAVN